jgi:hypothetical protein
MENYLYHSSIFTPGRRTKAPSLSSPLIGKQSNKDNENLRELVDILSITKILFDLDKDILK